MDEKTYEEAKNYCHGQGGILFEPRNEIEFNEVIKKAPTFQYRFETEYWIGVDDTKVEGTFVYGNNLPITWEKWGTYTNEPNGLRNENCVAIKTNRHVRYWKDVNCFEKRNSICEISNQNLDGRTYAIRALNFLTKHHSLADFGYEYYKNISGLEDGFDIKLYTVMTFITDFQEKNKEFINSLVGGSCPFNKEKHGSNLTCSEYCGIVAPNMNLLLHWQYVIGIEFQVRELEKQLGQIEGVDSTILTRFKEILYKYEEKIYKGDTLNINCLEFSLCPN